MRGAADQAHAMANGIKDIPDQKIVTVTARFTSVVDNATQALAHSVGARSVPGAASGMDNWRGGPLWVGESGKELLDLPAGSKITTHSDSMKREAGARCHAHAYD